jgi:hypothetical protein
MNDHEEMWFGLQEGIRIVQEAHSGSELMDLAGGIDIFKKISLEYRKFIGLFSTQKAMDVYVICFSEYDWQEQPDGLLSMWRGYGANGAGVALVFNTRFVTLTPGSPFLLTKVRYGTRSDRAEWLKDSFARCLTLLRDKGDGGNYEHLWHTAWHMFRLTLYQSLSSKHPGFAEENEWRMVYLGDLDNHKLFNDQRTYYIRGNTVEPKLKFPIKPSPLEPQQNWNLDTILDRVVLGPTHYSSFAMTSVRRMLESCGKRSFGGKLWASEIPYRAV